jgi:hypothetical protein
VGNSAGKLFKISRSNGQIMTCKQVTGKLYGPTQLANIPDQGDLVLISPLGRGPSLMALDTELNLKWFFPPDPETNQSQLITACE